uniref:Uncharacterized protein n=1 Tax=Cucumis sativus TaxID=3659 RepID=A0A0A0L1W0_CUCSA
MNTNHKCIIDIVIHFRYCLLEIAFQFATLPLPTFTVFETRFPSDALSYPAPEIESTSSSSSFSSTEFIIWTLLELR